MAELFGKERPVGAGVVQPGVALGLFDAEARVLVVVEEAAEEVNGGGGELGLGEQVLAQVALFD